MGKDLQYYCYAQMLKNAGKFFKVIPVDFVGRILDFQLEASGDFLVQSPTAPLPTIKNVYSQTMAFTGQVSNL
jgi:hypothetical protein